MTGWDALLILVTAPLWGTLIFTLVASVVIGLGVWGYFMYLCAREIKRGYD